MLLVCYWKTATVFRCMYLRPNVLNCYFRPHVLYCNYIDRGVITNKLGKVELIDGHNLLLHPNLDKVNVSEYSLLACLTIDCDPARSIRDPPIQS